VAQVQLVPGEPVVVCSQVAPGGSQKRQGQTGINVVIVWQELVCLFIVACRKSGRRMGCLAEALHLNSNSIDHHVPIEMYQCTSRCVFMRGYGGLVHASSMPTISSVYKYVPRTILCNVEAPNHVEEHILELLGTFEASQAFTCKCLIGTELCVPQR
jgi:hypothetical protein